MAKMSSAASVTLSSPGEEKSMANEIATNFPLAYIHI